MRFLQTIILRFIQGNGEREKSGLKQAPDSSSPPSLPFLPSSLPPSIPSLLLYLPPSRSRGVSLSRSGAYHLRLLICDSTLSTFPSHHQVCISVKRDLLKWQESPVDMSMREAMDRTSNKFIAYLSYIVHILLRHISWMHLSYTFLVSKKGDSDKSKDRPQSRSHHILLLPCRPTASPFVRIL